MKRIFALLLSIILVFSLSTVSIFADTPSSVSDLGGKGEGLVVLNSECGVIKSASDVKTITFTLPYDSIITVSPEEIDYTGRYTINIPEVNFEAELYSGIPQTETCKKVLKAGTYTANVKSTFNDFPVTYEFSLKAYPVVDVLADSIKVTPSKKTITMYDTYTLKVKTNPSYATDDIVWFSANSNIASVNSNGKVTGKRMGTTTIKAVSYDGDDVRATSKVTVNKMNLNMWSNESISLSKYVKYIPSYKTGKWSSNKSSVVKVSSSGKITGRGSGSAKVYFKCKGKTYTFNIYSYSKSSMKKKGLNSLKSVLKSPSSLQVNEIKYSKADDRSFVFVMIDYSAMNSFGGYNRDTYCYVGYDFSYFPYY